MSTRGGTRTGAGRPKGGVTDTRRRIIAAISQGLAQAGRRMHPDRVNAVDDDQAAIQTGAMIVDDMIQAGQGNDVMKLWAAVALKETDSQSSEKNTLARALSRLPGAGYVADVTQKAETELQPPLTEGGTTHTDRVAPNNQPYFAPQVPLMLNDPVTEPAPQSCDDESQPQTAAASYRQASQPPAPPAARRGPPPPCPAVPTYTGKQGNF